MFVTLTLIAGTYAVSGKPRYLVGAIVLAGGAFASQWLTHFVDKRVVFILARGLSCGFFLLVTISVIVSVMKGEEVTTDKICGAICGYLLMGVTWAFLFGLMEIAHPGSFLQNGQLIALDRGKYQQFVLMNSMVYYSLSNISTSAYGDILAKSTPARALSNLEPIAGQMYVAVLISRLVALHVTYRLASHTKTKE